MKKLKLPVFYDAKQRRRKILLRLFSVIGIFAIFISAIVVAGAFLRPLLPLPREFSAITESRNIHALKDVRHELRHATGSTYLRSLRSIKPISDAINMAGFYVEWDDTSFASLKSNINKLQTLTPEELAITETGGIQVRNPDKFERTLRYIQANKESLQVLPLVSNFNEASSSWDADLLVRALSSTGSRSNLVEQLAQFADTKWLDGINVDFEEIPTSTLPAYYVFLKELGDRLHEDKRQLQVDAPVGNDDYDYAKIAQSVDSVVLMAYDQHWLTGTPGSVAGLDWFKESIAKILKVIPPEKTTVAIGNYGYDWTIGKKWSADAVTFQEAHTLARESESDVSFDPASLNPHFGYSDEAGRDHEVWYLDAVTAFNQISVARDLWVDNFTLWRIGSEDPSFWKLFDANHFEDNKEPEELKNFGYGYEISYTGQGEFYRVTETPKEWARSITFTGGLITDEKITTYPTPYVISRYGAKDSKKIALTFDDGPDPEYTPKILDILRDNKIHGSFFVVGQQAQLHPDLVKRMMDEWHMIGSHTFTHPDISRIGEQRLGIELNLTQRLIESITGHSTVLFRPPYGEDIEPETPDEVPALERSNTLGYITVGMKIDPNDWKSPPADVIVKSISEQVAEGRGNVVLLHDSGWDRTATVEALPTIISTLKKQGYTFVGLDELAWESRDSLMPKIAKNESWFTLDNALFFWTVRVISWALYAVFFLYLITGIFRLVLVLVLAFIQRFHEKRRKYSSKYLPKLAVIVPAYNEETVILRTIESVLATRYKWSYEILVVDDWSKDSTYKTVADAYNNHPIVRPFTKPNGGKWEAINFAIEQTKAEIIIVIDADTLFDPETIPVLVRHFADPMIGAVSGNVKVGNRINLLTKLQAYEYISGQNLDRRAYDAMNTIMVVPGAIGAWRREAVIAVGGFSSETLAEDSDLTISLLRANWRIVHENNAYAYTEAPSDWKTFGKQRFRWIFGILQVAFKHADVVFDKNASFGLRFFVLPHTLLSQTIFPAVAPIADIATLMSVILVVLEYFFPGLVPFSGGLWNILAYVIVFVILDFMTSLIVFLIDPNEDKTLLLYAPIQRIFYRFFMHGIYLKSLRTALSGKLATGRLVGWDTFERSWDAKIQK